MTNKNKKKMTLREALNLARRGVSPRSIAAKAGMKLEEMMAHLQSNEEATRQFEEALADFEIERVLDKDEIMNDPETDKSLKLKIIREDLKTLGQWATASKPVHIVTATPVGSCLGLLSHEEMSPEQLDEIRARTESEDGND